MTRSAVLLLLLVVALGGCGSTAKPKPAASPVPGNSTSGTGYTVMPPPGWSDRTQQDAARLSSRPDRLFLAAPAQGFAPNVNVLRRDTPAGTPLEKIVAAGRGEVARSYRPSELSTPVPRELGGDRAFSYRYVVAQQGKRLGGEQVITLHGGKLYFVTFTAAQSSFALKEAEFQRILGSWRWK